MLVDEIICYIIFKVLKTNKGTAQDMAFIAGEMYLRGEY